MSEEDANGNVSDANNNDNNDNNTNNDANNDANSKAKPDFVIPSGTVGGDPENETSPANSSYLSETVPLKSAPLNSSLLGRLERQKYKYWHFKFVDPSDLNEFKKRIMELDPTLTVHENYGGQQHADITIRRNQDIVGKLHFLHANRPDICDPKKFYVKVHYYHFTDKKLMGQIKAAVHVFFDDMEKESVSQRTSYRGGKKTRKSNAKRNATRKTLRKTLRKTRRHKN
jgi:hypothetical protein